jgi:UDP-N-acetylmuramate dehydrogenase
MPLLENMPLMDKHTFHLPAKTRYWADFGTIDELRSILSDPLYRDVEKFPVGGGSNLLFTRDFPGMLIHSGLQKIEVQSIDKDTVLLRAGSGVVWDDLVEYAVVNGWSGLENLSGIPGEVGASPVQNIGAYGSEAKDCIESVEALDLKTLEMTTFSNADCRFGYRDSVFKKDLKNKFIVCYVTFKLSTNFKPNTNYGDLNREVEVRGGATLRNVRNAVLDIRASKLPDPSVLGNAGSFFMNPEITPEAFDALRATYPDIPNWPLGNGKVKISAAWCIDRAGWKGKAFGNAAVHDKQALVLVNTGQATAEEISHLSDCIVQDVEKLFGVRLHPEVLFL